MEDEIKELKSVLRSLVVSSPTQVDVRTLMRDYRSMVGKSIPLAKYGYRDPVLFLKERCDDCFLLQGQSGNPVLTLIVPDTLKHIDKFVQKQKISSTKKYKEKRRSIPAAVLSPPTNLISATFAKKQKETKTPDQATTASEVANKHNVDTKAKSDLPDKENDSQHSQNGTCSRSALENFMKKRIPLYDSLQYEEAEKSHNDKDSSKDDADSGRQTSSSSSSAKWTQLEELKTEIKTLIGENPEGIWCSDLIGLYRDRYGRELNFARFGYTSVLSLACVLEDSLRICRPRGAADWKLLPATIAPLAPLAPLLAHPPHTPAHHGSHDVHLIDPEDALPGIEFDPDVFPEDCLHYMESIPAPSLDGLEPGAMMEVMVGEVYSPSHLWLIRLGESYNIAMEDIMDEMKMIRCSLKIQPPKTSGKTFKTLPSMMKSSHEKKYFMQILKEDSSILYKSLKKTKYVLTVSDILEDTIAKCLKINKKN